MVSDGKFQSLVGFKINWNRLGTNAYNPATRFQSLVGFKINWNEETSTVFSGKKLFQSLVGFKINWNTRTTFSLIFTINVSIPSRV